jgi:membrane-associated phospholipid phosphatase
MMLLVFFWPEVRTRGRIGLTAYVLGMAVTLVYAGEHYVTDVLVGWIYAIVVVTVLRRISSRRAPERVPAENPLTSR